MVVPEDADDKTIFEQGAEGEYIVVMPESAEGETILDQEGAEGELIVVLSR